MISILLEAESQAFLIISKGQLQEKQQPKILLISSLKKSYNYWGQFDFFGPKISETSQNLTPETLSSDKGP